MKKNHSECIELAKEVNILISKTGPVCLGRALGFKLIKQESGNYELHCKKTKFGKLFKVGVFKKQDLVLQYIFNGFDAKYFIKQKDVFTNKQSFYDTGKCTNNSVIEEIYIKIH